MFLPATWKEKFKLSEENKLVEQARRLLLKGKNERALSLVTDWLVEHPESPTALEMHGSLLMGEGEFTIALAQFSKAKILGFPDNLMMAFQIAACCLELEDYTEAFDGFSRVIASEKDEHHAYFLSAAILMRAVAALHMDAANVDNLRIEELDDDCRQHLLGKLWDKQSLLAGFRSKTPRVH